MGEEPDMLFYHLIRAQELTLKQFLILLKDHAESLLHVFSKNATVLFIELLITLSP